MVRSQGLWKLLRGVSVDWTVLVQVAAKFPSGSDATKYHPLLYHMLDVAAVAQIMFEEVLSPALQHRIADGMGIDEDAGCRWTAFLAGIHDLGKACPAFQAKDVDRNGYIGAHRRLANTELEFSPEPFLRAPGHGAVTANRLAPILVDRFHLLEATARRYAAIVGGHHGSIPSTQIVQRASGRRIGERRRTDSPWDLIRARLTDEVSLPHARGGEPLTAPAVWIATASSPRTWG